ncbi:MAG: gliding motility-associated C-terminal domain-containing protein [Cytophagaceae bacterium]|nr:MAG: gliding motility-associated C-terminal domain-containing protein [Cytophagaceae bacterium]
MIHVLHMYSRLAITLGFVWLGSLLAGSAAQAQVGLQIVPDPDGMTYRIYLTATTSYTGTRSIIPTAQITLSVPHGTGNDQFVATNLTAGIGGMHWIQSDRADAPAENPDRDYLFFSFINSGSPYVQFPITAGQSILLFTFQRQGSCLGLTELMNNATDPFRAPNSLGINPGTSITLLGTPGNAYRDAPGVISTVHILPASLSVCAGVPVSFSAVLPTTSPSTAVYMYQWFVDDQPVGMATYLATMSYTFAASPTLRNAVVQVRLILAGKTPCQSPLVTDRQTVQVTPLPVPQILYMGSPCTTLPISLTITPTNGATYQWFRNATLIPGRTDPSIWVETSGGYTVQVTLNHCQATSVAVPVLGVTPGGEVTVYLAPLLPAVAGTKHILNPQVTNAQSFTWSPAYGLSSAFVLNPVATPTATTTYTLTAQSAAGCQVSDTVTVHVLPPLYIPTAFTPNGDGLNDTWEIRNTEQYASCQVSIYNQWGNLIFYDDTYGLPWNGQMNGHPVQQGVYLYTVKTPFTTYHGRLLVIW